MHCKNCNEPLISERRYCPNCGAKVIKNRLTLKNLSSDFSEQFLSYDNKFLKTFIDLFKVPEHVINGYILGTRKKYINVVQYLAISITLLGLQYLIINSINPEFFIPEPTAIDEELAKYYTEEMLQSLDTYSQKMNEHMSLVYLIGLPISALITWIVFLKEREHNFTEHMVINMYVTAQYIVCSVVAYLIAAFVGIDITTLIIVLTIAYIFYFAYVFYRLYHLRFITLFLRFLYSIALFLVMLIFTTISAAVIAALVMKLLK